MKTNINWEQLLIDNEESILEAIKTAYCNACGSQVNSGFQECVDITQEGKVSVYTISQNSTAGDVWNGEAFEICRIDWFNPLDGVDNSDAIKFMKDENIFDSWIEWLKNEGHLEEDDNTDEDDLTCHVWTFNEFNSDAYAGYLKEVEEVTVAEFDPDGYYDRALQEARLIPV